MDPYLEAPRYWQGFHANLASEIQAALNRTIRPRYVADIISYETYEVVEIARSRGIRPDVTVLQPQPVRGEAPTAVATGAVAPVESRVPLELPLRLYRVEIRTTGEEQVVTAIEILSPVNKRPSHEAYAEYLRKRRDLLRSSVHLIEIDLLRGGTRPPLQDPVPASPYRVVLSREERRPCVEVWPIRLADPLPSIPVPLLSPDPDASLDLGAVVASVYERAGYEDRIDYGEPPPTPALTEEEAAWVASLLGEKGVRGPMPNGTT
jgi:hypothetical protein